MPFSCFYIRCRYDFGNRAKIVSGKYSEWKTMQLVLKYCSTFIQLALKFWRYRRKRLRSSSTLNKSEPSAKSGDLGHGIGIDHIKPIRDEKIPVNLSYGNDHIKPHRWKSSEGDSAKKDFPFEVSGKVVDQKNGSWRSRQVATRRKDQSKHSICETASIECIARQRFRCIEMILVLMAFQPRIIVSGK